MKRDLLVLSLALTLLPGAALAQAPVQGRLSRSAALDPAQARAKHSPAQNQAEGGASGAGNAAQRSWTEKDKIVHLLNRMTFGPGPGDIQMVQAMGIDKYIEQQLHPESIPEAKSILSFCGSSDAVSKFPDDLVMEFGNGAVNAALDQQGLDPKTADGKTAENKIRGQMYKQVMNDTVQAKLMGALDSPRQLEEVMTEFWFNHFNIYSGKGNDRIWIGAYEGQAIRPFALGKFRDLVGATCHHAAMIVYLDNATNSAPKQVGNKTIGLNENYARELMELHTLGVDGGYTQADVIQLAHVLTGLTISGHDGKTGELKTETNNFGSYFNPRRHDFGDKVLLGRTIRGTGADEIEAALDTLCREPATAHHISYQLAQYFVCDNPPRALVDRLSARFSQSDGDIKSVLRELFHSPEFWNPANADCKFKSPLRYLLSIMRATGERPNDYARVSQYLKGQGEPLYGCLTPDGYKNVKEAWLNPDALLHRANFAVDLATGHFKGIESAPINVIDLYEELGIRLAPSTVAAIDQAPDNLKPALLLGSPEFMLY